MCYFFWVWVVGGLVVITQRTSLYLNAVLHLNLCLPDCIFFVQKDYYYKHISAIFEWTLSVNLEVFELSYAVEFYFFSSAMLSVLLSKRDEEKPLIMS